MTTDTSERGLERLICRGLTVKPCDPPAAPSLPADVNGISGGTGWICRNSHDYNENFALNLVQIDQSIGKPENLRDLSDLKDANTGEILIWSN